MTKPDLDAQTALPAPLPALPVTLGDLLLRSRAANPSAEALVFPTERLTYDALAQRAWRAAQSLAALGVKPGDRVGIMMLNSPDLVVSFFAISMVGAIVVPINVRYRSIEIDYLVRDAGLSIVLTNDVGSSYIDLRALLAETFPGIGTDAPASDTTLRAAVDLSDNPHPAFIGRGEFYAMGERVPLDRITTWCDGVAARDIAALIYTSGTTAKPKGVMLSHEALVRGWMMVGRRWGIGPADAFWDPCPLFHIAAIGPMIFTLGHGACFVTDTHFDAGRGLAMIAAERATMLYPTYPPITQAMIDHPDFASTDLSSVKVWLNVAPPETLKRYDAAIPHARQITTYGQTEGGPVTLGDPAEDRDVRLNTCGMPMPGAQLRIRDPETGAIVAPGVLGEILFRGFSAFSGYFNDPEKTALTLDAEGWVHTGDLGEMDAEGHVTFRGRLKEMLKVGGENIAPAEVEQYLESHPAVRLAQVFGIPDPRLNEVVAACVEIRPGPAVTEGELIEFCRGKIASFKVPRVVRFVTEWPTSATKIQRSKLREQVIAELGLEAGKVA